MQHYRPDYARLMPVIHSAWKGGVLPCSIIWSGCILGIPTENGRNSAGRPEQCSEGPTRAGCCDSQFVVQPSPRLSSTCRDLPWNCGVAEETERGIDALSYLAAPPRRGLFYELYFMTLWRERIVVEYNKGICTEPDQRVRNEEKTRRGFVNKDHGTTDSSSNRNPRGGL